MIIFYNKDGNITGTIEGRIATEAQLGMWIGKKEDTDRIICNWKQIEGSEDFTPDVSEDQKQIFIDLDKNPAEIFKYKIDTKTKMLVLI